jgi:hypothetical protein
VPQHIGHANNLGFRTFAAKLGAFDIEGREVAGDKAFARLQNMYAELTARGEPGFCDIWVKLFSVEIDDVRHGLFYEQSKEEPWPGKEQAEWVCSRERLCSIPSGTTANTRREPGREDEKETPSFVPPRFLNSQNS